MEKHWVAACGIGACVQVAKGERGKVLIRKSDYPKIVVTVTKEEWSAFVEAVKCGDFDNV